MYCICAVSVTFLLGDDFIISELLEKPVVFCYTFRMKRLFFILASLIVATLLSGYFFVFKSSNEVRVVTIPRGATASEIAGIIHQEGLANTTVVPKILMYALGLNKKMQFGTFEIPAGTTLLGVLQDLTQIQYQEREITLLEGWSLKNITDYLVEQQIVTRPAVVAMIGEPRKDNGKGVKDWSAEFSVLQSKPKYVSLEGFIFPDTYRLNLNATAEDIVRKTLQNFDKKLTPDLRAEIVRQKKTIFEIVTMASILEREVKSPEDKALVADIFWRRIARGMGLEADSTVNYATGKSLPSVTLDDLKINSPWNTYKYRGLPPGPISNPGLDSIKAAIYPKPNLYWYFLTTSDGRVIYGKTFEEHINNKKKYLK